MKPGDLVDFDPYGINGEEEPRYGILLYEAVWGDWAILCGDMIIHCPLRSFMPLDKIGWIHL